MKKTFKKLTILLVIFIISLSFINNPINPVQAQDNPAPTPSPNLSGAKDIMKNAGVSIGYNTTTSAEMLIGNIIQIVLSLVGIFFLILVIIGGYQWMTAGGNEETLGKAKKRVVNATMGLAIVLAAYIISRFIIDVFLFASNIE